MNQPVPAYKNQYPVMNSLVPLLLTLACLLLPGCQPPFGDSGLGETGCKRCHRVRIDPKHDFSCGSCHNGNPTGWLKREAHQGLVAHPAGPDNSRAYCSGCHREAENSARHSMHYSMQREINLTWHAFFPGDKPPSVRELHGEDRPRDSRSLVRDLLARRCLRCHVYHEGDSYRGTVRGTGCAACHMDPGAGGHYIYRKPRVKNCLSCHYANFTGWDYQGRFEKDYPEDFRAPLKRGRHLPRAHGVEWISMQPDIHKKAGLTCLDCHRQAPFHPENVEKAGTGVLCTSCHDLDARVVGHRPQDLERARCGVCHAVWTALDIGRNLLRLDRPDMEEWKFLSVQGSSEIEKSINEWAGAAEIPPDFTFTMKDKITGKEFPGLWMAGFQQKRWGPVIIGECANGTLSVIRPLLDISISYVDRDEEIVFDSLPPEPGWTDRSGKVVGIVYPASIQTRPLPRPGLWLPYHPHTTGKADIFRTMFVQKFLLAHDNKMK